MNNIFKAGGVFEKALKLVSGLLVVEVMGAVITPRTKLKIGVIVERGGKPVHWFEYSSADEVIANLEHHVVAVVNQKGAILS